MIFTLALILHKLRTIKRFHFTTRTAIQCSHDLNSLFSTCTLNRRLSNLDRWSSEIVVERLSASWEVIMNNNFFFFFYSFFILLIVSIKILESSANPKHRVATFLDKLKRSGPTAFPALLNVLRTGQPHLADLLSVDPGEDEAWSNPTSKSSSRQGMIFLQNILTLLSVSVCLLLLPFILIFCH